MIINVISIGKLKDILKPILNNYIKKISLMSKINFFELKEQNNKNVNLQKNKETEQILKLIFKKSNVFLLSLKGKQINSHEFSNLLLLSEITFVIGGSNGLEEKHFKNKVKFSNLTMPHQLCKIFLVEQIYRGLTIIKNMKYHK